LNDVQNWLKPGMTLNQIKEKSKSSFGLEQGFYSLLQANSVFSIADKNNDGILQENEIKAFLGFANADGNGKDFSIQDIFAASLADGENNKNAPLDLSNNKTLFDKFNKFVSNVIDSLTQSSTVTAQNTQTTSTYSNTSNTSNTSQTYSTYPNSPSAASGMFSNQPLTAEQQANMYNHNGYYNYSTRFASQNPSYSYSTRFASNNNYYYNQNTAIAYAQAAALLSDGKLTEEEYNNASAEVRYILDRYSDYAQANGGITSIINSNNNKTITYTKEFVNFANQTLLGNNYNTQYASNPYYTNNYNDKSLIADYQKVAQIMSDGKVTLEEYNYASNNVKQILQSIYKQAVENGGLESIGTQSTTFTNEFTKKTLDVTSALIEDSKAVAQILSDGTVTKKEYDSASDSAKMMLDCIKDKAFAGGGVLFNGTNANGEECIGYSEKFINTVINEIF